MDASSVPGGNGIPEALACSLCDQKLGKILRYHEHVGQHQGQLALFDIPRDRPEEVGEILEDRKDREFVNADDKGYNHEEPGILNSTKRFSKTERGSAIDLRGTIQGEDHVDEESMEVKQIKPPRSKVDQAENYSSDLPTAGQHLVADESFFTPATTLLLVRRDLNGVMWVTFEHIKNCVKEEYSMRCDIELIDFDELPEVFKTENCAYSRAMVNKDEIKDNRLNYETECNAIGWALAQLNSSLRGKSGVIQQAVNCWSLAQSQARPACEELPCYGYGQKDHRDHGYDRRA